MSNTTYRPSHWKLNLGCGRRSLDGYVNVDIKGGEVRSDAEVLPFRDGVFDSVLASHVLEHVSDLTACMNEIHRVLKEDGILEARVPTGLRTLYNPFHLRTFDLDTLKGFCRTGDHSYDESALFGFLESAVSSHVLPFAYHLEKYVPFLLRLVEWMGLRRMENGRPVWQIPLTPREEIRFLLQKRGLD